MEDECADEGERDAGEHLGMELEWPLLRTMSVRFDSVLNGEPKIMRGDPQ